MRYSARNALPGKIKQLTTGVVNVEVVIEVAPEIEMVSVITKASCDRLGLAVGQEVVALVKASNIILAVE
jgi:molybdopterin-binding protein